MTDLTYYINLIFDNMSVLCSWPNQKHLRDLTNMELKCSFFNIKAKETA